MLNGGHLTEFVRARLEGRETLRRVLGNSFWLFCDQLLRMAAGLVVGVWLARYLGPGDYGWFNYALATVGVVASLTTLGIGPVVVREIARTPAAAPGWLGAAFLLRIVASSVGFLVCLGVAWRHSGPHTPATELIPLFAVGLLLQTLDVADLFFQAQGITRRAAWLRMGVCVFGSALRVVLILRGAPLLAFAYAALVELAAAAVAWWWTLRAAGGHMAAWTVHRERVVALLRQGWPLALTSVAVTVQAYADQLVIGSLVGAEDLGQYAAAMRLVAAFSFVPMVVQTVSAPEITRAKRDDETLYRRRLHGLYRVMGGLFLVTGLPLILVGPLLAQLLYGSAYAAAGALLPWLGWRLLFTNLGVARSVFITNEGLFRFALGTAIAGAVVNVILNLLLVPHWGMKGAVISALVSFAVTTVLLEGLNGKARRNLGLMGRALLLPWQRFEA